MNYRKLLFASPFLIAAAVVLAPRSESQGKTTSYKIDAGHSAVVFKIMHFGAAYTWGRFNDMAGALSFAEGGEGSAVEVTVKTASVDTNDKKRDDHLRSPDFFSAKEFPEIKFKSTKWTKSSSGWDVAGDLTLHGVTKPVTVKVVKTGGEVDDPWGNVRIGFEGELRIKRSDFGMKKMIGPVGDDVWLGISIEAMRKK
ncbi:MAG: YceI family protein [Planctomycetota bacterium]